MSWIFWRTAAVFHAVLIPLCLLVAWRERARLKTRRWWALAFVADAWGLVVAILVLAGLASLWGLPSGFTVIRLVAQALFGEVLLLVGWLAFEHGRVGQRGRGSAFATMAVLLLTAYVHGYHYGPTDLRVRHESVDLRSRSGGTLRVLHISDIQTDAVGPYEERVMREAAALRPDIVVFTGDFVHPRMTRTWEATTAELRALLARAAPRAPLGLWAVRGDVDWFWPTELDGTPVKPLTGETVRIPLAGGRSLCLIGLTVGMSRNVDREDMVRLVRSAPRDDVRIVLGHNPDFVMTLADAAPVDLALAGHTHGGQVVLPFLGPPITKSELPRLYASGLHDYRGVPLHVSSGVGMERGPAPQVRFLCPPSITLLEVRY